MLLANRACEGKGNAGKFIDRLPKICAAGVLSKENESISACLQHYLLKDEIDAVLGDAIFPPKIPPRLPPLRKPRPPDMRNAAIGDVAMLINPPNKTKFRSIVDDIRETSYISYWNKRVGKRRDCTPFLPDDFDFTKALGKKVTPDPRLYDIILPKEQIPEQTPKSKRPAIQTDRKYCAPPFNKDTLKGRSDYPRGRLVKCCLVDSSILKGDSNMKVINRIAADRQERECPAVGKDYSPNNNIEQVPKGHTFGKVLPSSSDQDFLVSGDINPDYNNFLNCVSHLNSVKKCLSKLLEASFFRKLYLEFKYNDKEKTNWLPKLTIYKICAFYRVRFDPKYMEPLLFMCQAFDGERIEYKTFVDIINFMLPSPELPKVEKIDSRSLRYSTTSNEIGETVMNEDNSLRAGIPSGRYYDLDYPVTHDFGCKADRDCLQDESDVKSCLNPGVLTNLAVSHRDMFAVREPNVIRRVFEAIGETFPDDKFDLVWKEAQKSHSEGKVCVQTFREALKRFNEK